MVSCLKQAPILEYDAENLSLLAYQEICYPLSQKIARHVGTNVSSLYPQPVTRNQRLRSLVMKWGGRLEVKMEKSVVVHALAFGTDNTMARFRLYKGSIYTPTLNPVPQRLLLRNAADIAQDSDAGHDSCQPICAIAPPFSLAQSVS